MDSISAIFGSIFTLAGVFVTYLVGRQQRSASEKLARNDLAIGRAGILMERFSSGSYMEIRDEVELFLASIRNLGDAQKIEACRIICRRDNPNHVRTFNRMHALGMFFGEVGVTFESGFIDCAGLGIFDRIIPYYWHQFRPFIIACHSEFRFKIEPDMPLQQQDLALFGKFACAYNAMVTHKLAKEPNLESGDTLENKIQKTASISPSSLINAPKS